MQTTRCIPTKMFKVDPENSIYTDHEANQEVLRQANVQRLQDVLAERRLRPTEHLLRVCQESLKFDSNEWTGPQRRLLLVKMCHQTSKTQRMG